VIERHLTFDVLPDQTDAFERFFAEAYGPTMAKAPGFARVELLREADSATRYQMVLRFEDADSAVAWRTADAHTALQPTLNALHTGMAVQGYDVIA
jgi:heme-degrading monooxygenase HmoA